MAMVTSLIVNGTIIINYPPATTLTTRTIYAGTPSPANPITTLDTGTRSPVSSITTLTTGPSSPVSSTTTNTGTPSLVTITTIYNAGKTFSATTTTTLILTGSSSPAEPESTSSGRDLTTNEKLAIIGGIIGPIMSFLGFLTRPWICDKFRHFHCCGLRPRPPAPQPNLALQLIPVANPAANPVMNPAANPVTIPVALQLLIPAQNPAQNPADMPVFNLGASTAQMLAELARNPWQERTA
ncbi:hypothetical protein QBC37DRAFT_374450 [Rhypophila decipiens]|uniref:Uncharacterized protein n=1 Tax=Rhypophila decipiens TaxID=261697 RepID=A0AAN6YBI2_9PEZI|nr:hypothetical protein QBC37DRAFT_374450 [Rhypophila decipiens]